MRDVGERAAVDEGRVVLERLHQVRRERIFQEGRHRAVRLDVAGVNRLVIARIADDDLAEAFLEVLEARRETEDRHHFGGDHDVEPVLPRITVARAAETDRDVSERTVVDVQDAAPGDAPDIEAGGIAMIDVIVDQRREQVVGERDRREVASEVEIDVLHRDDLCIAATGRTALHAEYRAERRFAQANDRLLANAVERIAEADRHRRLAFARGRRGNRGDQNQFAVPTAVEMGAIVERNLRLVVTKGL